jgi:hypothetical protein
MKRIGLLLFATCIWFSCKKKAEENPTPDNGGTDKPSVKTGSIKLEFQHLVDGENLKINTDYMNPSGETFQITQLKYYVTNIRLIKPDGSETLVPESYYLVDIANVYPNTSTVTLTVPNVAEGNYSAISYLIGVDSTRTESGAQTGDLSPSKDMYWAWDGYMAMHFEGNSPVSPKSGKYFSYSVMGYKGQYNATQKVTHSFGSSLLMAKPSAVPMVHFSVEALEFFKNPSLLSIAKTPQSPLTADSANVAISKNYRDMFKFEHVHN